MWFEIKHPGQILLHTDVAGWLVEELNQAGATQFHVIDMDLKNSQLTAIYNVPNPVELDEEQ